MSELLLGHEIDRRNELFFDVFNNEIVKKAADEAYITALSIMSINKVRSETVDCSESMLPIDVMSSTRNKFQAESEYGLDSLEFIIAEDLQEQDCIRLIDEVVNAKTFRLREPIFQSFDYISRDYTTLGKSHREMVKKGLSPYCNEEERIIRQIEFIEEEICASVQEDFESQGLNLINIKECPEWALDAYTKGEENTGGYVPSENKFVIQIFKFVEGGRVYQQASIPGNIISHQDILNVLSNLSGENISGDKLDVRRMFFGTTMDLTDIVELLDEEASRSNEANIYLGSLAGSKQNYDNLDQYNNIDNKKTEIIAKKIIKKLDEMHKEKINPIVASRRLDNFLTKLLISDFRQDKNIMQGIYGINFNESGFNVDFDNLNLLPKIEYCGAGSCGIDFTNQYSSSSTNAKRNGLKGEIGYFSEGKCIRCNSKGFYVADNGKFCDSCGAVDIIK